MRAIWKGAVSFGLVSVPVKLYAATESKDIAMTSPDIAENGAVVPFTVASKLAKTESIALLVEKNPNMLAANFTIPDGTEPWINTRIKRG